ncbi:MULTISPECIES: HDOD domain-containing protein [Thiorhodovibrio]|uniref:HDOD domain-containing protein n=1 Tax=Thiorhodovibrio TaxID=61593 RepID=UPI0019137771|nr:MULTISPECIES: HDOD domain-containing protein [Thiorhodovibrio]MBK5970532.1 histidine kinase [Thiorhodovibrio winogradskyi]WPL14755.1 HDOD domain protein [Thiorhodovibrio litoralis]
MSEKSLIALVEERFDADSEQLPVFNRVALDVQKLKESETATMNEMTTLIMRDQALTSRILQVANSSFYGGLKQVDTLSGAVLRLGLNKVASLAMMASQLMAYQSKRQSTAERMGQLWQRAYVCASGSRWIAENCGLRGEAEAAFLSGLLHDVGELFLLKALDALCDDAKVGVSVTEQVTDELLGAMHNEIGYRLMKKWELPECYALTARDHHTPSFDHKDRLLAVTRLLDWVCLKLGVGQQSDPDIMLAATAEAQALGLREIQIAQLEVMIEDMVSEAKAML